MSLTMNTISMLTAETSDIIIKDPLVYEPCVHMMEEAAAIGEAIDIPMAVLTTDMIGRARMLGAFKTSMLRDTEA
jgi:ketopantoate reductase